MKYLILICCLFCSNSVAFCQDSITVRTEIDTFSTPQYQSDYDAFFLKQQPKKVMVKFATNSILQDYGFSNSEVGIIPEFRIAQGFSINIGWTYKIQTTYEPKPEKNNRLGLPMQFYLEPRYYFNKKAEIAKKESADNLIGPYMGIRTSASLGPLIKGTTYTAEAILGSQQLFFLKTNRGLYKDFVDFNLGLGASYNKEEGWTSAYHCQVQFGGFFENLGKRPQNNAIPAMCDVYQCHVEEKRLFKIDLINLVNISNSDNLGVGLNVEYEQKINQSTFSINSGLSGILYSFKTNVFNNKNIKGYTFKGYLEPRWYFRMKEEIANGTSANNLSGAYIGLQTGYQNNERNNYENTNLKSTDKNDYFYAYFVGGQQQRILKHLFIEMKGGIGVKSKKVASYIPFIKSHLGILCETKIGLAF